jgi:drug/metabolite transporter (DMT)-like permease
MAPAIPTSFKGMSKVMIADLQILGSAFFFGIGFLGQRAVMINGLGPMTCNAFRFGLSTILLAVSLPLIPDDFSMNHNDVHAHGSISRSHSYDKEAQLSGDESKDPSPEKLINKTPESNPYISNIIGPYGARLAAAKKTVWFWGIFLGFINFMGSGFQQWGISMTSASKCAFIAGFDLFLTPVMSFCMPPTKHNAKPKANTWVAVGISLIGLFLLSGSSVNEFEIGMGEILSLISTVFWTLHITFTDVATSYVDTISMMCIQFGVVTLLSSLTAFAVEPQQWLWDHLFIFMPWLLFLAVSEGLGFTLMAIGQNYSPPTHAAIILSLEGVFAAIASYVFLGEVLSRNESMGCLLMLVSAVFAI